MEMRKAEDSDYVTSGPGCSGNGTIRGRLEYWHLELQLAVWQGSRVNSAGPGSHAALQEFEDIVHESVVQFQAALKNLRYTY